MILKPSRVADTDIFIPMDRIVSIVRDRLADDHALIKKILRELERGEVSMVKTLLLEWKESLENEFKRT